jgi:hypothetical protein
MGFNLEPKKIVLGIDTYDLSQLICIKQGFIGSMKVKVSFIGRDKKLFIIPTGSTAKIRMIKPDKKKVLNDTENDGVIDGNTVIFDITDQMQAYPGNGALEIILFNGGETVTSSTCGIKIIENVHDDSGIESTDEWLTVLNTLAVLEEKIQDANEAIDNANEAAQELINETLLIYKPNVANYASIATTYPTPEIGWATVTDDTSIRWRWNGTEWKNVGTVQNIGIANNTTPGTVKGGDNVTIAIDGQMSVDLSGKLDSTSDIKDNIVTFSDATTDAELTSGNKISVLIGLIKYKLSSLLSSIGTLASLTTTVKTNLVSAVNELVSGKIDKTSISTTDTENSTTKVAAAAVAYSLGQEIDEIRAKTPSDLTYIHSFYARKNDISGTTSTIRGDISYMISMKGILSGGFGFDSVSFTDKPSSAGNWGYIEFFKHADSFVTVKLYPETVENGIFICQFVLGGSDWAFPWKKITLT